MFSLHQFKGRFRVGASTFVAPVRPAFTIGSAKLPGRSPDHTPQPALQLEEIAFTAYYPANISPGGSKDISKGLDWLIRPVNDSLRGYVKFAGRKRVDSARVSFINFLVALPLWLLWPILYLFGVLVKIPVYPNAPLLHPATARFQDTVQKPTSQWPLVIFSHGLGGSRTAYSQICSRLAASGKVVLAIEHRDGSGHVCFPRSWGTNSKSEPKAKVYLQEKDVIWDPDNAPNDPTPLPLRTDQLVFRQHEIYLAYTAFCNLVQYRSDDNAVKLETIDGNEIDWKSWSALDESSGTRVVRCEEDVSLAGHSFGGCTVLSILSTRPPSPNYPPIPVTKALVFDPWLEPFADPGPTPLSAPTSCTSLHAGVDSAVDSAKSSPDGTVVRSENGSYDKAEGDPPLPRMLVINSQVFTLWTDHFTRLRGVVERWEPQGRSLLTLVGSQHSSFSDFPLLPVIRSKAAQTLIEVSAKLAVAFLDGRLEEELGEVGTRKMEIEIKGKRKDGKPKRRLVGSVGDVVAH